MKSSIQVWVPTYAEVHTRLSVILLDMSGVYMQLYMAFLLLYVSLYLLPGQFIKKHDSGPGWKLFPKARKILEKNIIIILLKQGIICLPSITFNTVNILSKFRSSLSIMICIQSTLVSELMRYRDKIEYVQNLNLTQIFII